MAKTQTFTTDVSVDAWGPFVSIGGISCLSARVVVMRRGACGFTLLELLVVLVLASITTAVVGAGGQAFLERARYTQAVRDVASQLNKARVLSVQEGRPVSVTYLPDARRLAVDGKLFLDLHEAVNIQWEAMRGDGRSGKSVVPAGELLFIFNPDGGARGGRISVLRGSSGVAFRVNWLLGTVEQSVAVAQP